MVVLFLVPYPLGESPSQRFRFEQYFQQLDKAGIRYRTQSFWDEAAWRILYKKGHTLMKIAGFLKGCLRRIWCLVVAVGCDRIFIHRECAPVGPPAIEWVLARVLRKKIIYDFDDSIWLPNTSSENKLASLVKWHGKVKSICRWSYNVSCGNAYLAHYARQYNANVIVNPTTIDTDHHHNPVLFSSATSHQGITIGWTGSHSTLKYLQEVETVLQRIVAKFPQVRVVVIADRPPALRMNVTFVPWVEATEIPDLMQFDIGIMPLPDDLWAKGKCGFKALQYMALEIPAVASPVGVNSTIIDNHVDGLLCATEAEWEAALTQLVEDAALRKQLGKKGREKIVSHYSVASNTGVFLSLFA